MKTSEDFILRFHSLKGTTVGEKKKNLFLLLKSLEKSDLSDFNFTNLQPTNLLEERFKLDVLIHFKRVPELLEILKSENHENIEKIFKIDRWFFETAFGNINGKDLVTEVFPFVSFNVKVKLLNKLSEILTDTRQADGIFSNVKEVYGLHLASKILPACTYDLIVQVLETQKLKLPPRQLFIIVQKYPENGEKLLEILQNFKIERECNNILEFLKETDISSFTALHKKHRLSRKLGRRTTDRFILNNKEAVIEDPNGYYKILHNKQIAKSLRGDFCRFFKNLFPTNIDAFLNERKSILPKLNLLPPKVNALDLYLSTFHLVYGSEIWDHPKLVTVKLLKMLDPEERQKRLREDYRSSVTTEDEWMCLYNIKTSIPFLKKRISLTSDIKTRADLIGYLVDTCKINEDKAALSHVCRYVISKHRNDNITARVAFLHHIRDNFVLEMLEEEHWVPINEMIQIFQMNQESFYEGDRFFECYIHYRLRNNLSVKEELTQRVIDGQKNFNLIKSEPAFERICLQMFGEIIPEVAKDENLYVDYLCAVHDFNCRNKKDEIPLFTHTKAIEVLNKNISKFCWTQNVYDVIVFFLNNVRPEEKSQYLKLLLAVSNRYSKCKTFDNLLKKDPSLIVDNIEAVVHFLLKTVCKQRPLFLKRFRYYDHLNIPQAAVEYCKKYEKYLTDRPEYEKKHIEESAFTALSLLMTKCDFLAYLFNFYPEGLHACTDKNKFKKQKLLSFNLRNIYPASDALQPILNFCKGDYLKFVLGSLYLICGNVNEDRLIPVLEDLSNRAVSVQKHCLHLSFRYMNRQCIFSAINKFMEIKMNLSVRKFILKVLLNFFSKNPDDYIWTLLKTCVNILDVSDTEAFDLFLQIDKIPTNYLTSYQVFAWDVLDKLPNPKGVLDSKRASVLNSVDNEGSQMLPVDFCQKIINGYLFRSDEVDTFNASIQSFACKYVIYCNDRLEKEERLKSTFEMMKYYIKNRWSNLEYRNKTRTYCSKFVQTFCASFLSDHSDDREVLQSLFEMWNGLLLPHEDFGNYLYLKFTLMYLERYPLQQLAKEFLDLCNRLTETYGLVIVELLYNVFTSFTDTHLKREGEDHSHTRYQFIENLVNLSDSETGLLMAILLLGNEYGLDTKTEGKKNEIVEKVKNKKNVVVDLFLYRHFRGTTTLDYY